MFSTVQIDPEKAESLEQLGTKRKFWFIDEHDRRMLFKAEERGSGEDWAEKIACELAARLGLPHVHYDLAVEIGTHTPGVVCESCATSTWSLVMGNELLLSRDPGYPSDEGRKYKVREHTVDAVVEAVQGLCLPPAVWCEYLPKGVESALDVFVGYVMLDAWVANQDRHHQNWAALKNGASLCLSPTFDHGASLARNLIDKERAERLSTRDSNRKVEAFVLKARSAFYQSPTSSKSLGTLEAWLSFASRSPDAAKKWLDRLNEITDDIVARLVDQVPTHRMSPVCREFTRKLLHENKARLLAEDVS